MLTGSDVSLVNTALIAAVSGLVGWAFQDLRKRVSVLEMRIGLVLTGLFYLISGNPTIPEETKRALLDAMRGK